MGIPDNRAGCLDVDPLATPRASILPCVLGGDGIVTLGEECDDRDNDGGYGECAPDCMLGPHCGDGMIQEGEDCDDGNYVDDDECGSSCRIPETF